MQNNNHFKIKLKMKHLLIMLTCVCTLCCCSQTEELENIVNDKLGLTAPSGDIIAPSLSALKSEIMPVVAEIYEIDKDINIEDIHYASIEHGYIATISFTTDDGVKRTIIKTDKVPLEIAEGTKIKQIKSVTKIHTRTENQASVNGILIVCSNPSPNCNCTPVFKTVNGAVEYTCSKYCDDCDMTISKG